MISNNRRNGNLLGDETDMPVKEFLEKSRNVDFAVAGLLDYGYDFIQIGQMLNKLPSEIEAIIRKRHYLTAAQLAARNI